MDVSVICPVFNVNASFLRVAIESVANQSGSHNIQLIIVDDCSVKTETREVISEIKNTYRFVDVVRNDTNSGPSISRQHGLNHAKHKWIGFIDADDIWPSNKIDQVESAISIWPDSRWVCGNYATLNSANLIRSSRHIFIGMNQYERRANVIRLFSPEFSAKLVGDWLPLGASFISADLLKLAGGFDPRLRYGEDWLLALKLSNLSPADYIVSDVYILRRQGVSMMRSPGRMSTQFLMACKLAKKDPSLNMIARQLRWKSYNEIKDLAMNHAINGRRLRGFIYSIQALFLDPREVPQFLRYLSAILRSRHIMKHHLRKYSTAEQVDLEIISKET